MLKNILRLLAASASFVALLFVTNSALAIATTPATNFPHQFQSPTVSLNVASPSWQLASNKDSLTSHFGCSCTLCTQSLEQSTSIY